MFRVHTNMKNYVELALSRNVMVHFVRNLDDTHLCAFHQNIQRDLNLIVI